MLETFAQDARALYLQLICTRLVIFMFMLVFRMFRIYPLLSYDIALIYFILFFKISFLRHQFEVNRNTGMSH